MFNIGEFVITKNGYVGQVTSSISRSRTKLRFSSGVEEFTFSNSELEKVKFAPGDSVCILGREGTFTIKRISKEYAYIDRKQTNTPFHWPVPYSKLRSPNQVDHYMGILKK